MPRTLATALAAGVLGIGVATATVVGVPAVASAVTGQPSEDGVSKRVTAIRDALQGLVDDRTITDEQADKVADTLGKSEGLRGGPGGRGLGIGGPEGLQTLAGALGMSEDDLRTALRDGTTIADLAEKQGKEVADVQAALVKAATDRLDQAVKDGRLTQEQADRIKADLAERMQQFVENGGKFGRGFGGRGGHAPGETPASPDSPTPSPSATA
jgi:ribosomal protein S20